MASGVYHAGLQGLVDETIDFTNDTIKCALFDDSHTFSDDDDTWDDISANELADGVGGYSAGGDTLTTKAVNDDDGDNACYLDADDPEWTDATFSAYHAVIYEDTGVAGTSRLICSIDFGGEQSVTSSTFTIQFNAKGFMKLEDGTT